MHVFIKKKNILTKNGIHRVFFLSDGLHTNTNAYTQLNLIPSSLEKQLLQWSF